MKKNYITPNINVVQVETICNGGILQASVHQESLKGVCISQFDVVGEEKTKFEEREMGRRLILPSAAIAADHP